jgi:GNAT superfamily N-acetyltransferase
VTTVVSLSDRPDLLGSTWDMESPWPEFMLHDPIGARWFGELSDRFAELQHVALDEDGAVIGRILALPFEYDGSDAGLPDRGWDAVLEGASHVPPGMAPTAASLIEARVAPAHQGRGLSRELLVAACDGLRRRGVRGLFGRCARPPKRASRMYRWPTTSPAAGTTGCPPIRGCACTFGSGAGSCGSARSRW